MSVTRIGSKSIGFKSIGFRNIGSLIAAGAVLTGTVVTAGPAHAGGRPTDVAFVHANYRVQLHRDHSVTVREHVQCDPAWAPAELDVHLSQGSSYGDGLRIPAVPCDDAWHAVRVRIAADSMFGRLHAGPAQANSQFLVTNVESGDSAAGHEQEAVKIVPPRRHHH